MFLTIPYDEIGRRGASPASNDGTLSRSSTPSVLLGSPKAAPRSLELLLDTRPSKCLPQSALAQVVPERSAQGSAERDALRYCAGTHSNRGPDANANSEPDSDQKNAMFFGRGR
jgi:hypothetical protein